MRMRIRESQNFYKFIFPNHPVDVSPKELLFQKARGKVEVIHELPI